MSDPAVAYEAYMVPSLFVPALPPLLETARPQPNERILDLASGTGIVARTIARMTGAPANITGLDINPAMLEVAREKSNEESLDIQFEQSTAENLPFDDGSFDLVVCQQGLQFLPNLSTAFGEIARVLNDHGRFIASTWEGLDQHPIYAALTRAVDDYLEIPATSVGPFALGDSTRIERRLVESGFRHVDIQTATIEARFPNPDQWLAMNIAALAAVQSTTRNLDEATRAATEDAAREKMDGIIRDHTQESMLIIPMHAIIVQAAQAA